MAFMLLALLLVTQPGMAWKPAMALLAFSTEPVMATRFAWWHLRTWSGQYYFVHPDGWFEELEPWELVAIEFAFATEPAMAVYVDAVSHMMTASQEWPPVWNADLQIWQASREEPGRGSTVAQPLDLDRLWHSQQQPATGSAWNQPAAWNQPGTGSAWNHQPGRGYARSSWEPGQGYWEPDQGSWAPPVALQAAPQAAQVEGNLSSLGGGELRKAGTSPMLVIKGQGLTLRLQGLGPGALVHPAEGWKEGGCRGGVKKHLTT